MGFFVPAIKSLMGGIGIISHCDTVKVCLTMDKVTMEHPSHLMEIICKNLDQVLGQEWRQFKAGQ